VGSLAQSFAEIVRHIDPKDHPDALTTASNLSSALLGQGKHAEAEVLLLGVLAARQSVLGPAHPSTLRIASSLEYVRARKAADSDAPTAMPGATSIT
jgi:hypothetical protein